MNDTLDLDGLTVLDYLSTYEQATGFEERHQVRVKLEEAITARLNEAMIKELQWAAYAIGDLHMERVGLPEMDAHTEWVERDRRTHHKILQERISKLQEGGES